MADATLARAWELWKAGEAADSLPLAEWRLLDLEASLRREQHRFPEALARLDEALAACDGGDLARGRLLTNKANVLQQKGDHAGALAALAEAAPAVEASGSKDLLLRLRFNTSANLCNLERYAEAEALLPGVRELAIELGQELILIRVVWLQSKLSAGQGRTGEALSGLQQVSRDFANRRLPYEAALSSLDLAVLLLGEGRTAEVQQLATTIGWIFRSKGIAREALAALSLFCEAARHETATVEITMRTIAEVEKAKVSAPSR
jgi:tetratricopeptide (TPR) repeat protein